MTPTREDYEAAAKAAGYDIKFSGNLCAIMGRAGRVVWAPLHEDDDAFRLAAALNMSTYYYEDGPTAETVDHSWTVEYDSETACAEDLKLAAMREAIFMCAVLIGRAMK